MSPDWDYNDGLVWDFEQGEKARNRTHGIVIFERYGDSWIICGKEIPDFRPVAFRVPGETELRTDFLCNMKRIGDG